jgi:mono/diheme cytochrome c family protein
MAYEEGSVAEGEFCLSCHSAELILYTRIGEAAWKAEVTKMRNWGAGVEESKAEPFALWCARRYPASESAAPAVVITSSEAFSAVAPEQGARSIRGDKQAGAAAYAKDCASCHGASAQGTGGGPVLVEAPVLYQPKRFAALTQKGKGRMPAFATLSKGDIDNMLVYLRNLK